MEEQKKKWYATWKFALLVFLIILLLVWLLLPDEVLDAQSGLNL